jgi:hypothetical protein
MGEYPSKTLCLVLYVGTGHLLYLMLKTHYLGLFKVIGTLETLGPTPTILVHINPVLPESP